MKSKKYKSIENKTKECSIWYIRRVMDMYMTNELQNQGCPMQKRQLKTIEQGFQVEIYKEGG